MKLHQLYFIFLLVSALCLVTTMLYMTNICRKDVQVENLQDTVKVKVTERLWGNEKNTVNVKATEQPLGKENTIKVKVIQKPSRLENQDKLTEQSLSHEDTAKVKVSDKNCECPDSKTTTESPSYTRKIIGNLSDNEWIMQWKDITARKKPCVVQPDSLIGRFNITNNISVEQVRNEHVNNRVKYGGVYRPTDCISKEKVAIIIPYRDREKHLNILVNLLHNILQRQKIQYGIYVVEMALPVQFNRGLLTNAGFLTASTIANYSCYIIHDVDLIPINDRNMYTCEKSPKHMSVITSKFPQGPPYPYYVGGVLAISHDQYIKLNGFSNLFFGWGGEDDDMYKRMEACNMTLVRPPTYIGTYLALKHSKDFSNPPNPYRDVLMSQSKLRKNVDGISSIRYHRTAIEFRPLYTWILIDCVESQVMQGFEHLQVIYERVMKFERKRENPFMVIVKGKGQKDPSKTKS